MSRARAAAEAVVAVVLLVALWPVVAVCAATAGLSLAWDEYTERRRVRRERAALAARWGEVS
ncbi:hypothetical protein [Actinomyces faecalis]|uniref:hypothetical protein n=1 Tax=Actinomyces faecalis TaxID=2722820 RepID=UPI0015571C8A|nr:hypothetical protein [Actinomyces faecalis]